MKPLLASLWQRRSFRIIVCASIILGVACLDPFLRQTLFGPRIDDMPWCVWEEDVRDRAHPERRPQPTWLEGALEKTGIFKRQPAPLLNWDHVATLPLLVQLAEDDDPSVRQFALRRLGDWAAKHETTTLPIYRRRLRDPDLECRLLAACGVWRASKDMEVKPILLSFRDDNDAMLRVEVLETLGEMNVDDGETFDRLVKLCSHPDWKINRPAVRALGTFGKRSVPILRKYLIDRLLQRFAALGASRLGPIGADLIPDLVAQRDHVDPYTRKTVRDALTAIDPIQFPAED